MEIYTDCSFLEKEHIAGLGVHIIDGQKQKSYSNWIKAPSNHYGELFAIYEACILSGGVECTIYTDSQTALDFIHNNIKRKSRGDFKSENHYYAYQMMRVLAYRVRRVSPNIKFEKVKAHRRDYRIGHINNSIADLLAKKGISKYMGR